MFFSVQVRDRRHLANVMRALRRIPEVKRVTRART
jgi:(p)ppGpp synthase/HD superfamily hydrolase